MRRFLRACAWMAVGVITLGLVLRASDLRGAFPVAQTLFPAFGALAGVLALLTLLTRRDWLALVSGTLALTYAAVGVPAVVPRTVAAGDGDLVVLSANLQFGRGDLGAVRAAAQAQGADVIVLTEVTPQWLASLDTDRLGRDYPHRVGRARTDAGGTVVLSRDGLRAMAEDQNDLAFDQPTVEITHRGRRVVLRAVHTQPPLPTGSREWRSSLWWLQRWCAQQPAGTPLVMAGDFNASQAHPAFRDLGAGMTDAHRRAGQGWRGTWPAEWFSTFVAIDHVLVRDLGVVDAGSVEVPGSDHRAVWARLRVS